MYIQNKEVLMNRDKIIIKTSFIGIIFNIILVIFKMIVGLIVGSIAIILDGLYNLPINKMIFLDIAGINKFSIKKHFKIYSKHNNQNMNCRHKICQYNAFSFSYFLYK